MKGAYSVNFSLIDKGLLEYIGPTGAGKVSYRIGTFLTRFQTGRPYDYAAFLLFFTYLALVVDSTTFFLTPLLFMTRSLLAPTKPNQHQFVYALSYLAAAAETTVDDATGSYLGVAFALVLLGVFGMVYNYKNFIITIMCIEIMYLGAVASFVFYGAAVRDLNAAIYGLVILVFGACECAIGIGLLVAVFRFDYSVDFVSFQNLGG